MTGEPDSVILNSMTEPGFSILTVIAAPVGIMSSSLRSFLRTIPGVHVVAQVSSPAEVLHALTWCQPHLLVLDADIAGPVLRACLKELRAISPTLNLVVLINNQSQQEAALAAGASHALLKGCLGGQLRRAIISVSAI